MRKHTYLFSVSAAWAMFTLSAMADPMIYKQDIELLGGPGADARYQGTSAKVIFVRPTLLKTSRCETEGTAETQETVLIYRNGKPSVDQTSKGLCPSNDIAISSGKVDCEAGPVSACLNKD